MYCSIEDAWGDDFNKHDSDRMTSDSSKSSVSSTNSRDDYRNYMRLKEKFANDTESAMCTQVMTHINTCKACQAKLKEMYTNEFSINNISKNVMSKIKENNDSITLLLICFLIVLLVKLFFS